MITNVYAASAASGTAATTEATTTSAMSSWIMIIAIFAIMYFLMIRPQNKREKEAKNMRQSLKPGDEVITIGGICGTVARVKEDSDRITIIVGSDRTKIEILKSAIAERHSKSEEAPTKVKAKEEAVAEEAPAKPNKKNIKKLGEKEEKPAEAPATDAQ